MLFSQFWNFMRVMRQSASLCNWTKIRRYEDNKYKTVMQWYHKICTVLLSSNTANRMSNMKNKVEHSSASRMCVMNHNWSVVSHETASSSASECSRDKPPFSFVRGQDSTMWDIIWVSPQGHRSVSVSRHFLLQAPQCPCSVRTFNSNYSVYCAYDYKKLNWLINFEAQGVLPFNATIIYILHTHFYTATWALGGLAPLARDKLRPCT